MLLVASNSKKEEPAVVSMRRMSLKVLPFSRLTMAIPFWEEGMRIRTFSPVLYDFLSAERLSTVAVSPLLFSAQEPK